VGLGVGVDVGARLGEMFRFRHAPSHTRAFFAGRLAPEQGGGSGPEVRRVCFKRGGGA
jgi:hypothetical protein